MALQTTLFGGVVQDVVEEEDKPKKDDKPKKEDKPKMRKRLAGHSDADDGLESASSSGQASEGKDVRLVDVRLSAALWEKQMETYNARTEEIRTDAPSLTVKREEKTPSPAKPQSRPKRVVQRKPAGLGNPEKKDNLD